MAWRRDKKGSNLPWKTVGCSEGWPHAGQNRVGRGCLSVTPTPISGPVILIEVRLGDPQEGAITLGSQREDEGLAGKHGQLSHQLPGLHHEQAHVFGLVDHALVDVQAAPEHEVQAHIL